MLLQWRLTASVADYWSFPLHCSFPPLPLLTLSLSLAANEQCHLCYKYIHHLNHNTTHSIFITTFTHTAFFCLSVCLSAPHHHPYTQFLSLSHTHTFSHSVSAAITSGNFCAVRSQRFEVWRESLKICQQTERERKRRGKEWGARLNRLLAQEGDISNTALSGTRKCFADRRCTHNVWHMHSHVQSGSIWKRKCV